VDADDLEARLAELDDNQRAQVRTARLAMMRLAAKRHPKRRWGQWDWLEVVDAADMPAVLVAFLARPTPEPEPPPRRKQAPLVERTCIDCGETFLTRRVHARYCSPACRQAAKRRRDRADQPKWQRRRLKRDRGIGDPSRKY
jgi:hypothetical protein